MADAGAIDGGYLPSLEENSKDLDSYNPEWASAVDDRGNVFFVESVVAANPRANLYNTPQTATSQRRSRLSPSLSFTYGIGLSVSNLSGPTVLNKTHATGSAGERRGSTSKSSHGEGEKRSKLKSMWKNLTGQRRGSVGAGSTVAAEEDGDSRHLVSDMASNSRKPAMASTHERSLETDVVPERSAKTRVSLNFTIKMSGVLAQPTADGTDVSMKALGLVVESHSGDCLGTTPGMARDGSPTLPRSTSADAGSYGDREEAGGMGLTANGLVVAKVISGSVAALALAGTELNKTHIHTGDEILQINGVNVTDQNLSSILAAVAEEKEISLKVERKVDSRSARVRPSPSNQHLLTLMRGKRRNLPYSVRSKDGQTATLSPNIHVKTKTVPHGLMYLTLGDSGGDSKKENSTMEDVLYHYPASGDPDEVGSSSPITELLSIRGLFLTLADILQSVTGTTTSSSLVTLDGKSIHVGYLQLGEKLLVLLLPAASSPLFYLDCVMEDMDRLLTITFGSIHSAFTKKRHKDRLDQLFSLIFQRLLSRDRDAYHHITDALHGIHRLPVPFDVQTKISAALSELEADDHSTLDEVLQLRRPFLILGSCLFYKGYLVETHLPEEDTQDVSLYCRYYCLLQLSARQRLGQLVIWHEIFLSRRGQALGEMENEDPAYVEQTGRTYLLIVGFGHALLCVLLEAGATTAKVTGHPGPVPYYVDAAEEVLTVLNGRGLLQACDSRIQMAPVPAVITAQQALRSATNSHPALLKFAQQHGIKSVLKEDGGDSDNVSVPTGSPGLSRAIFMQKAALPPGTAAAGFRKSVKRGPKLSSGNPPKPLASLAHSLTAGEGNLLFHYINVDAVAGVMVCPLVQHMRAATAQSSTANPSVHGQLVRTFHRTCITIREVLCRRCMQEPPDNQFSRQNSLRGVYEHGVLLQINPAGDKAMGRSSASGDKQRNTVTMNYWVVGRLFREPVQREFYVCYQESLSQNVVELAFKLCFGAVT